MASRARRPCATLPRRRGRARRAATGVARPRASARRPQVPARRPRVTARRPRAPAAGWRAGAHAWRRRCGGGGGGGGERRRSTEAARRRTCSSRASARTRCASRCAVSSAICRASASWPRCRLATTSASRRTSAADAPASGAGGAAAPADFRAADARSPGGGGAGGGGASSGGGGGVGSSGGGGGAGAGAAAADDGVACVAGAARQRAGADAVRAALVGLESASEPAVSARRGGDGSGALVVVVGRRARVAPGAGQRDAAHRRGRVGMDVATRVEARVEGDGTRGLFRLLVPVLRPVHERRRALDRAGALHLWRHTSVAPNCASPKKLMLANSRSCGARAAAVKPHRSRHPSQAGASAAQ